MEAGPSLGSFKSSLGKGDPATYLGLKRDDFQNHLNSEYPREDHVQNVHGIIEHLGLLVVLRIKADVLPSNVHDLTSL